MIWEYDGEGMWWSENIMSDMWPEMQEDEGTKPVDH